MDILYPDPLIALRAQAGAALDEAKTLTKRAKNLDDAGRRRKHHGFSVHAKHVALLLYKASGSRYNTPVKFLTSWARRHGKGEVANMSTADIEALVLQWWQECSPVCLGELASELSLGYTSASKLARTRLEFDELADWIAEANIEKGLAPTRADVIHQMAVIKNTVIEEAGSISGISRADSSGSKMRSAFRRFIRKWHIKRGKIVARPYISQDDCRRQALATFLPLAHVFHRHGLWAGFHFYGSAWVGYHHIRAQLSRTSTRC